MHIFFKFKMNKKLENCFIAVFLVTTIHTIAFCNLKNRLEIWLRSIHFLNYGDWAMMVLLKLTWYGQHLLILLLNIVWEFFFNLYHWTGEIQNNFESHFSRFTGNKKRNVAVCWRDILPRSRVVRLLFYHTCLPCISEFPIPPLLLRWCDKFVFDLSGFAALWPSQ